MWHLNHFHGFTANGRGVIKKDLEHISVTALGKSFTLMTSIILHLVFGQNILSNIFQKKVCSSRDLLFSCYCGYLVGWDFLCSTNFFLFSCCLKWHFGSRRVFWCYISNLLILHGHWNTNSNKRRERLMKQMALVRVSLKLVRLSFCWTRDKVFGHASDQFFCSFPLMDQLKVIFFSLQMLSKADKILWGVWWVQKCTRPRRSTELREGGLLPKAGTCWVSLVYLVPVACPNTELRYFQHTVTSMCAVVISSSLTWDHVMSCAICSHLWDCIK